MINKWILDNFKSIESREELEFRPLTIFTGANSSGKSTILQSVLLVSQTLQSSIVSRSIVLNGGIKKFGSYSDIVNKRDYKKDMTIGFEVSDTISDGKRLSGPWVDSIEGLKCQFSVGAKKDDDLQPYLKQLNIKCNDNEDKSAEVSIVRTDNRSEKEAEILRSVRSSLEPDELKYSIKIKVSEGFSRVHFDGDPYSNAIGVSFTHFLPEWIVSGFNKFDRAAEYMCERYPRGYRSRFWSTFNEEEKDQLLSILNPICNEMAKKMEEIEAGTRNTIKRKNFEEAYKHFSIYGRLDYFMEMLDLCIMPDHEKEQLIKSLKESILKLKPSYDTDRMPAQFIPGIEHIKEFFSEHIWYLGPLREEPKALYPLESDGSMTDVGYKGENTAAVFDFNRTRRIEYVAPNAFEDLENVNFKKKRTTFEKAIKEWLVYLGVASDIDTDDKGKIGHTMQISNDLAIKQDLTHVGVGVSQVLPILVLSLLAKPGDILIFEQPELHLHPKVQTRLADFFVAMNALGKQCLIETHSEYLINRLRYFVAKSENSKVADDTMIYFVEKEEGHSKYRPVTINKYGVIEDWPDGFFDESSKIAEAILEAGMNKRMQELGIDE